MGIGQALCRGLVVDTLVYREIGGFADATIDEISTGANFLLALNYEGLVQDGVVAVHGLNKLRQRFGRPLKAPVITPNELTLSIDALRSDNLIEFIHFSSDARGREVAPSAYALVHEIPVNHEPSSSV